MTNIEDFYSEKLLQCGFLEQKDNERYCSIGKTFAFPESAGEGTYWVYGQKDLFDIKIHDFLFYEDSFLEFDLSECLSITYYESISGEELIPYRRLSAGCVKTVIGRYEPYKAIIHKKIPIRSIGIEIMPAYYEQYLKSAYPNEDVSPYEAFQGIDETKDFPEMIYLLNQVKNYRGEGITAKLFYEGKVAEAVSLILQYNKNSTARTEQNISHQDMLLLNSVTAYVNDHFSLKLSLEQLARIACMGTTKLKKLFKQVHGCTISEYIQQRRMSHAESLLATTDLTIEQISISVGFSNPGGFSEVFRKSTGLLPKEYRKMAQRK